MAITVRVEMNPKLMMNSGFPKAYCAANAEKDAFLPGLRIKVRTTTSSRSDYPEWNMNMDDQNVVSDGACS
jgi:hypothetical protein